MKESNYFAIFGGGGIRGIAYCGAYKALLENKINLTGFAGSSIGAVFCGLLALDYTYEEIYEILSNTGFEMFIDINIDFKNEPALSKGKIFLEWMREKIERKFYGDSYQKGKMPPVKFSDIKTNLIIYSVDLTHIKFFEFSKEKTPDFEVASAIRASVSMPGLFVPFEYEGNMIVDGDLLKSMPLWRVTNSIKNLDERILEFRLEDNESIKKSVNAIEYLNRVYNAICGFATDYIVDVYKEKDKFDYIKINTEDVSVVDFLIPQEKKKELFDTGYKLTSKYLKEFLPQKREKLLKKYETLLKAINKFQKDFNRKNIINSYLSLCELFVFLCEEKQYLDSKIFQMIADFKNKFIKNYKSINLFGFKSALAVNKEEMMSDILDIIKITTIKVSELKQD